MKNLPLELRAIMARRGSAPVVVIIVFALIILFGGTFVIAWRTTLLDSYLPQQVKEFFGKAGTDTASTPTASDTQEPSGESSQAITTIATKDWKTYANAISDISPDP